MNPNNGMPVYLPAHFITLASFPDKIKEIQNNNHDLIWSSVKIIRNPVKAEIT